MRGNLGKQTTYAVEAAAQTHKEACELRLARITNGAEPSQKNGHEVRLVITGPGNACQWQSTSGRKTQIFRGPAGANDWRRTHPAWD
jgi:hypothetical protein